MPESEAAAAQAASEPGNPASPSEETETQALEAAAESEMESPSSAEGAPPKFFSHTGPEAFLQTQFSRRAPVLRGASSVEMPPRTKKQPSAGLASWGLGQSPPPNDGGGGPQPAPKQPDEPGEIRVRDEQAESDAPRPDTDSPVSESIPVSSRDTDSTAPLLTGFLLQALALVMGTNRQCLLQYVLQRSPGIKSLDKYPRAPLQDTGS